MTTFGKMPLNVMIDLYHSRGYSLGLRFDDRAFALGDKVPASYGWMHASDINDVDNARYFGGEPMEEAAGGYYRTTSTLSGTCAFAIDSPYALRKYAQQATGYETRAHAYLIVGNLVEWGAEPNEILLDGARVCAIL